jgi:hypothetical protein
VVLVVPISTERADLSAYDTTTRRLEAEPILVWRHLPPDELVLRLTRHPWHRLAIDGKARAQWRYAIDGTSD